MAADPKPQHKATIILAAFDQESVDNAIAAFQHALIQFGVSLDEGTIKYEMPLHYRSDEMKRRVDRLLGATPMDQALKTDPVKRMLREALDDDDEIGE